MTDTVGAAGPSGMAIRYDEHGNVVGTEPVAESTRTELPATPGAPADRRDTHERREYPAATQVGRMHPLPGERAEALRIGHEPAPPTYDIEFAPVSNTGPEVLSSADRMWIDRLEVNNLTRDEASQLRAWRRTTTRRDEHRLLTGLLKVDDEKRATEGNRHALQTELRAVTQSLQAGGHTSAGTELIAGGLVDQALTEATREEIARYQADPRRTEGVTEWVPETGMYVDVAYREHRANLARIEASRESLMAATIVDVETERRDRWNQRRDGLLARQRELRAQLNNGNSGG